ncbi:translation initiation factor IF-3, putative [Plasmodium ovale]|uniref:Translation initiation factor IF-3, putative n=1 Tax=Plasmodium ovale TaxID=36330 RepID=A0A1C3KQ70_PLAOA|nr:translation initiation factor IF-3, putative [Plasmodium ovale]
MKKFFLNKKLNLFPENLRIIHNFCKLYFSYFGNKSFFWRKYHFRSKSYCLEKVQHERFVHSHTTGDTLSFFLTEKCTSGVKHTANEGKPKRGVSGLDHGGDVTSEESASWEVAPQRVNLREEKNDETGLDQLTAWVEKNEVPNDMDIEEKCTLLDVQTDSNSVNLRKSIPYYNIDPSLKTKKIQIYHNCEMHDMIRKVDKIKKFLLNGNPVDILLICDMERSINKKLRKKNNKSKDSDCLKENPKFSYSQINNKFTKCRDLQKLKETKYSLHIYVKINFILNHILKIAVVDEIFRHIKNKNHIILIKVYPK